MRGRPSICDTIMLMTDLWDYLKETDKPIALYGTGNGADKIIAKLEEDGTFDKVKGIFASSGFVRDRCFHGIKVESYEAVKDRIGDMIVLLCFGSSLPEVVANVDRIAGENELYAPQVPVYGTDIFDEAFYRANRDMIEEARSLMADDLSRKTFDNTVAYYLSGDIKLLKSCEVITSEEYSLTSVPDGSCYVDLGAYTGDTVIEYTGTFPEITEVIAAEPDRKNYMKLISNTQHMDNVTCLNVLISDVSGDTHINLGKGRGVHEQSSGTVIRSETVDSIVNGKKADLIKYDVEGNELKALKGSEKTIKGYKPVLHVACYHRSEDVFELPLYITSLRDDYKIYMRHGPHLLNWDTQFICV